MGNLAGSSGVAYQTTHRSPLSYNTNKSSPMTTKLPFGRFERGGGGGGGNGVDKQNAREVMEEHNANAGSFYKEPVSMSASASSSQAPPMESSTLYDELIQRLSTLMETSGGTGEDKSDIRGDTLSQTYYYGITAIMLYLLYRTLYRKNRK